jgi:hypothetical protein
MHHIAELQHELDKTQGKNNDEDGERLSLIQHHQDSNTMLKVSPK